MAPVTMAFTLRCLKNPFGWFECWAHACRLVGLTLLMLVMTQGARAASLEALRVERTDDGLYLTANLDFTLSPVVEDALQKGIPVHFVVEADVRRERWYWSDQTLASARRYFRVAYQPLTRRWRLNVSSEPLSDTGLGVSLTQNFDSLDEVLAAVRRLRRWRIAGAGELEGGGRLQLWFQFRLDSSQLPRALQLGSVGQSDWMVSIERRIDLTQDSAR